MIYCLQYFLLNQIELFLAKGILAVFFFSFSFFKTYKDSMEMLSLKENCVSHVLMVKNGTQHI